MKRLFVFLTLTLSLTVFAHDPDQMGTLTGENLVLSASDHGFAGHIGGRLVFASPLEGKFGMLVRHRAFGKDFDTTFEQVGKGLQGEIQSVGRDGKSVSAKVVITKASPKEGVIEGTLGADPFTVKISASAMDGHHYLNPQFDASVGSKTYQFKMDEGQSCLGCAIKTTFLVLGMLRVTGEI